MFDKMLLKLPGMKGALALMLIAAFALAALAICQAFALASALAGIARGSQPAAQLPNLGMFFVCYFARRAIGALQDELLDRYAAKRAAMLRDQLLACVFDGSASLSRKYGTAHSVLAATDYVDDVERYIRMVPSKLCSFAATALPILVALFVIDWISGLIAVIALPVIVFFMVVLGKQARHRAEIQFEASSMLATHFIDAVRGMATISSLGASERAAGSVFESSERMRRSVIRTLSIATLSSAVLDLVSVFGVAAVSMMLAFRLMDASVSLQVAFCALMLTPEYFAPIKAFASDFHASLDGKNALAEVLAIIADALAGQDGEDSADASDLTAPCTLEARDIRYSPQGSAFTLDGIAFDACGAQFIGIVGSSGSGKSTLIDLLAGFRKPDSGTFAVNGKEVDLSGASWKRLIHYVPQNPHIFRATLEDNVRFYAPDARREDVERAIGAVGLCGLENELPEGLDTVIGEAGRGLSGGESQRIALARALLDDRPVLLFDEPTAHLDIETEYELKQRMAPLFEGKLVFFATHRLHWLSDMDHVIVLERGAIAEAGTPQDLLRKDGALARFIADERGDAL